MINQLQEPNNCKKKVHGRHKENGKWMIKHTIITTTDRSFKQRIYENISEMEESRSETNTNTNLLNALLSKRVQQCPLPIQISISLINLYTLILIGGFRLVTHFCPNRK